MSSNLHKITIVVIGFGLGYVAGNRMLFKNHEEPKTRKVLSIGSGLIAGIAVYMMMNALNPTIEQTTKINIIHT